MYCIEACKKTTTTLATIKTTCKLTSIKFSRPTNLHTNPHFARQQLNIEWTQDLQFVVVVVVK